MSSKFRTFIGRLTSPVFVPLRKLVVWGDESFGTCDHRLVVVPRTSISKKTIIEKNLDSDITLTATEFYDKYAEDSD